MRSQRRRWSRRRAVDEPRMLGDRRAVTGQQSRERHRAPCAPGSPGSARASGHARRAPGRARRSPCSRRSSPAGGRRRTRTASASSTNSVSVVLWPGRATTRRLRPPALNAIAVGEAHVGAEVLGRGADVVPELVGVGDDRLGNAVVAHQRAGEPAVLLDLGGVARGIVGHRVKHGHGRARAALDRGGEADVVEMVMRREQQLDVLDAQPVRGAGRPRAPPERSSSRGPVSISVTGSPRSSQAFTDPTCASGRGMATAASMN